MNYLTFKSIGATQVALNKILSPNNTSIQFRRNEGTWIDYTFGHSISLGNADIIEFSGNSKFSRNIQNRYNFTTSGEGTLVLSGDLISLVSSSTVEDDYEFNSLFSGCANIVDASQLVFPNSSKKYSYSNMFKDCVNLITPPSSLPSNLDEWCFQGMFAGCLKMNSAPLLPATDLVSACYWGMFYNCKSLQHSPNLPASTLVDWCYDSMFFGCKNLNQIESELTAWLPSNATKNWVTYVDEDGIFKNDTVEFIYGNDNVPYNWVNPLRAPLTFRSIGNTKVKGTRSNLSCNINNAGWISYNNDFISLSDNDEVSFSGVYNPNEEVSAFITSGDGTLMVYGNTHSLIGGGQIQNYCFNQLFKDCKNIVDASKMLLPATDLASYCYRSMFAGCTSLTAVPMLPATGLAAMCYQSMFTGCSSLVSVPQDLLPASQLQQGCYHQMFYRCSSLENAPLLSSTTLANGCYVYMFYNCSNLTEISLPATELVDNCYSNMFEGCTKLSSIEVAFTDWTDTDLTHSTKLWVSGVAANGTFTKPSALSTAYGENNIPQGWTVINK